MSQLQTAFWGGSGRGDRKAGVCPFCLCSSSSSHIFRGMCVPAHPTVVESQSCFLPAFLKPLQATNRCSPHFASKIYSLFGLSYQAELQAAVEFIWGTEGWGTALHNWNLKISQKLTVAEIPISFPTKSLCQCCQPIANWLVWVWFVLYAMCLTLYNWWWPGVPVGPMHQSPVVGSFEMQTLHAWVAILTDPSKSKLCLYLSYIFLPILENTSSVDNELLVKLLNR